jgi:hypothetical protein
MLEGKMGRTIAAIAVFAFSGAASAAPAIDDNDPERRTLLSLMIEVTAAIASGCKPRGRPAGLHLLLSSCSALPPPGTTRAGEDADPGNITRPHKVGTW